MKAEISCRVRGDAVDMGKAGSGVEGKRGGAARGPARCGGGREDQELSCQ